MGIPVHPAAHEAPRRNSHVDHCASEAVNRLEDHGEAGLWDGREDKGNRKMDLDFLGLLDRIVRSNPQEHFCRRPTWTRELLVATMLRKTGARIHKATMSRALAQIWARRGPARATVNCPQCPGCGSKRDAGPLTASS